jgi:vanillate O-demethylase ferredoxin subunit
VRVHLASGLSRSYSLVGEPDGSAYRIAVALDRDSRGGSRHLHQSVAVGDRLRVDPPASSFRLVDGTPCAFVAGGIGITPFVSMIDQMSRQGRTWRLLYAARRAGEAAYLDTFGRLPQAGTECAERLEGPHADRRPAVAIESAAHEAAVQAWFDDQHGGTCPDLSAFLASVPLEWHLYCCGPAPMIDAFLAATRDRPAGQVHLEYFRAEGETGSARSFVVELARSGRRVQVPAGSSILDALMMEGIDAPYSCYEGLCGTCETRVLEGVPEHRDQLLTDKARASNQTVIICRSGSLTPRLVLDL